MTRLTTSSKTVNLCPWCFLIFSAIAGAKETEESYDKDFNDQALDDRLEEYYPEIDDEEDEQ